MKGVVRYFLKIGIAVKYKNKYLTDLQDVYFNAIVELC